MDIPGLSTLVSQRQPVRILDVRTPGEFSNAHISGAYNVPLDLLREHTNDLRAVTDGPVVLVCQSGQRAEKADALLRAAGMPNVHVLEGGMNAWLAASQSVIRVRKRMSLERQVRIAAGAMVATGSVVAITVSPLWALLPAAVGAGLVFSGVTDTCTMGLLLAKLPYNRTGASCDTEAIVRQFIAGETVSQ